MQRGTRAGHAQPRISAMSLSRALRLSIGRLLIGVILLTQFAVTSHACPGLKTMAPMEKGGAPNATRPVAADAAVIAESVAMPPGCDQMDPDAANLCAAHCHQGLQSVDTAAAPMVGLGIPTFLYALPVDPRLVPGTGGRSYPADGALLQAAPEPPHAILHCVFRI